MPFAADPATRLSRGAVRTPLPRRSTNLRSSTCTGKATVAYTGVTIAVMAYPIAMKGLFRPILSLQKPEVVFASAAVLSAMPSITESVVFDAPIDTKKSGIIE